MSDIRELQAEIHSIAKSKGWWDGPQRNVPEILALIHSEISEALEEYRDGGSLGAVRYGMNGKPEGFGVELADAVIRILDASGALGLDMEALIREKIEFNKTRPYRHGGKLA